MRAKVAEVATYYALTSKAVEPNGTAHVFLSAFTKAVKSKEGQAKAISGLKEKEEKGGLSLVSARHGAFHFIT